MLGRQSEQLLPNIFYFFTQSSLFYGVKLYNEVVLYKYE